MPLILKVISEILVFKRENQYLLDLPKRPLLLSAGHRNQKVKMEKLIKANLPINQTWNKITAP
jgi:hypothetical protein